MKKALLLPVFLLTSLACSAQLIWGIKGGAGQTIVSTEELVIQDRYRLSVDEIAYGIHGGLFFQLYFKNFLIQPEFLLNSNRVDYRLEDLRKPDAGSARSEKYQHLDIPLLLGFQFGALRLQAGPEAHVYLNSTAFETEGYEQQFENLTFGWQAGAGIQLWSLLLDARYEGNFNDFGDHLTFFNESYTFGSPPNRLLLSLSVMFNGRKRSR